MRMWQSSCCCDGEGRLAKLRLAGPPFAQPWGRGLARVGSLQLSPPQPRSPFPSLPLFPVLLCALVLADPSPGEIVGPPGEAGEQRGNPAVSNTSQTMPG